MHVCGISFLLSSKSAAEAARKGRLIVRLGRIPERSREIRRRRVTIDVQGPSDFAGIGGKCHTCVSIFFPFLLLRDTDRVS